MGGILHGIGDVFSGITHGVEDVFGIGGSSRPNTANSNANAILNNQINIQHRKYNQNLAQLGQEQINIMNTQGGLNWNGAPPIGIQPLEEGDT